MNDLSTFLDTLVSRLKPDDVFEGKFNHDWKKTNSKWRGLCPTHESRSGTAFYMRPDTLQWYCPSCGVGGGPIQYTSMLLKGTPSPRGKDFIDIAKELGESVGLPFPEKELSPKEKVHAEKLENRRAMLQAIYSFCNSALLNQSKIAKAYVYSRGLTDLDIQSLQLGIFHSAPVIVEHLTSLGFDMDDISECGIAYRNKNGDIYSPFENHVTIPWLDEYGRPLTLYGRYMAKVHPEGKNPQVALKNPGRDGDIWLASKKSPLYFDRAKATRSTEVTVVEGLFDAALLQSRGDNSVIAWVAANPTEDQLNTLVKHGIKTINLCLDPDEAGDGATFGCVKKLIKRGIIPFVIPRLPEKVDPDDYVIEHGIEAWNELKYKAEHGLKYAAKVIAGSAKSDKEIQDVIFKAKALAGELKDFEAELNQYFWPALNSHPGISVTPLTSTELAQVKSGDDAPSEERANYDAAILEYLAIKHPRERRLKMRDIAYEFKIPKREVLEDIESIKSETTESRRTSFLGSDLFNLEVDGTKWIVPRFVPHKGMILFIGRSKDGKSTLMYDLIVALLKGRPFLGEPVRQKHRVLVVQCEEHSGLTKHNIERAGYWANREEIQSDALRVEFNWNIADLETLETWVNAHKPSMVFFDSLRKIARKSGLSENSPEFGVLFTNMHSKLNELGVASLCIHHQNKSKEATGVDKSSGHNSIPSVPDNIWDYARNSPNIEDEKKRLLSIYGRECMGKFSLSYEEGEGRDFTFNNDGEMGISAEDKSIREKVLEAIRVNQKYYPHGVSAKTINKSLNYDPDNKIIFKSLAALAEQSLIGMRRSTESRIRLYYLSESELVTYNEDTPPPIQKQVTQGTESLKASHTNDLLNAQTGHHLVTSNSLKSPKSNDTNGFNPVTQTGHLSVNGGNQSGSESSIDDFDSWVDTKGDQKVTSFENSGNPYAAKVTPNTANLGDQKVTSLENHGNGYVARVYGAPNIKTPKNDQGGGVHTPTVENRGGFIQYGKSAQPCFPQREVLMPNPYYVAKQAANTENVFSKTKTFEAKAVLPDDMESAPAGEWVSF